MKQSVLFVTTLVLCLVLSLSGVLVGVPAARAAGTGIWTQLALYGGYVTCLGINPATPATPSAGTNSGGVFRYDAASSYALTTAAPPFAGGSTSRSPDALSYAPGYTFTSWSGDLTGATNPGTITTDTRKTITATLLPAITGDPFEPDNDAAHASSIATDGSLQHRTFEPEGDEDWVKFTAVPGTTYTIDTLNAEANAYPAIDVLAPDGTTFIDQSYSDESRIDFECPAGKGGTYYVRVWQDGGPYGLDAGYDFRVQPGLQVALSNADNAGKDYGFTNVLNHVTMTVTRGGVPVAGASVNVEWGTSYLTTNGSGQASFTCQKSWETYSYLEVTSSTSKVTEAYFWVIDPASGLMSVKPRDVNGYYLTRFPLDAYDLAGGWSSTEWYSGTSNTLTVPVPVSSGNLAIVTAASDRHGGVGHVFTLHPTLTAGQKTVLTPAASTDCVALSLSATLDGARLTDAIVYLRNQTYATSAYLYAARTDSLGASLTYVTPGTYTAVVIKEGGSSTPIVWLAKKGIVASSPTSAAIAVTTSQLGTLTCTALDGNNNPAPYNFLDLQSEGVSALLRTIPSSPTLLLSPGTYQELRDYFYLYPSGTGGSEYWYCRFDCSASYAVTAGSVAGVTFGGPLTMTVNTPSPVNPGQGVTTKLSIADPQGHRLLSLYGYTDLSPSSVPDEPTKCADLRALQGERPAVTPDDGLNLHPPAETDDWSWVYPKPHLLITDPAAMVKVDRQNVSLDNAYWYGYSWTVPADAAAGTWHAAFTFDPGAYGGVVSTDQAFAVSALPTYTLTTSLSPTSGGTIGRSPDAATYASGTVVTLTATPAPGYTFTGWSGDLLGTTNPTTITMTGNRTVTATFSPALVLSASWNLVSVSIPLPISSIPGLQAVYGYHDGWSVPVTLTPGQGYWVQVQNAVTVPLPGTPSTSPVALAYQAGWQLLGNPFDVPLPISSITNHGLITTCYSYDLAWGILNPATDSLQPGKGYWIYLSAATTLTLTHP